MIARDSRSCARGLSVWGQRWVREPKAKRKSDATDEMHALMHLPPSDEELYEGHSK